MKKKGSNIFIIIFILLIVSIITIFCILKFNNFNFTNSYNSGACYTKCKNKVTITDTGIADAVEKAYDAVVLIENYQTNKLTSTGTGFIYKVDKEYAYVLTNFHVINGYTDIKVLTTSQENKDAIYIGGDEFLDVAVLKIENKNINSVVEIGSSEKTRLGDTVFTIGTPVDNKYMNTVTRGILSGKDRLVSISISGSGMSDYVMKVLQTDAAMNPGNSGGPLLNVNGEVIGINSLKIADNEVEGMGFAIPIEDVMDNIDALEKGEKIKRPLLGVGMMNFNDTYNLQKEGITLSDKITNGVVVGSVVEGSPAYGILQKGDVVIKIDDEKVPTLAYFRYELYKHQVGDTIKVTFIRGEKSFTKDILLDKENVPE